MVADHLAQLANQLQVLPVGVVVEPARYQVHAHLAREFHLHQFLNSLEVELRLQLKVAQEPLDLGLDLPQQLVPPFLIFLQALYELLSQGFDFDAVFLLFQLFQKTLEGDHLMAGVVGTLTMRADQAAVLTTAGKADPGERFPFVGKALQKCDSLLLRLILYHFNIIVAQLANPFKS